MKQYPGSVQYALHTRTPGRNKYVNIIAADMTEQAILEYRLDHTLQVGSRSVSWDLRLIVGLDQGQVDPFKALPFIMELKKVRMSWPDDQMDKVQHRFMLGLNNLGPAKLDLVQGHCLIILIGTN